MWTDVREVVVLTVENIDVVRAPRITRSQIPEYVPRWLSELVQDYLGSALISWLARECLAEWSECVAGHSWCSV
ncbi:hypothetical protein [Streptomyces sp. NPDC019224]|uniref:hypothetical protein n=1 Tax=Streptomyces sp. NPDC019224 TaxID=3154484 RepID=UPI0033E23A40